VSFVRIIYAALNVFYENENNKIAARAERRAVASPDLRASRPEEISEPLRFWNVPEAAHFKVKGA
jgi:hypothetical protein